LNPNTRRANPSTRSAPLVIHCQETAQTRGTLVPSLICPPPYSRDYEPNYFVKSHSPVHAQHGRGRARAILRTSHATRAPRVLRTPVAGDPLPHLLA